MVATIYGISRRRIQQLVKYYVETGEYPMLDKKRRQKTHLSDDETEAVRPPPTLRGWGLCMGM